MPCLAPSEFYEMQQCRKAQQQQEEEEEEELQVIVKREDRMDESDEGQERESERGGASEDDGYQEGVYSYSTGENAADSLSSPPPPAPNRSPKPANMGGVRKGKWTAEEEAYTSLVIRSFDRGLLMLQPGVTLRAYLSEKLNCDPMRITKKFAGVHCIGKRVFQPIPHTPRNLADIHQTQIELDELENQFLARLGMSKANPRRKTSPPPPIPARTRGASGSSTPYSGGGAASDGGTGSVSATSSPTNSQGSYGFYENMDNSGHGAYCRCRGCRARQGDQGQEQEGEQPGPSNSLLSMSDHDAGGLLLGFFKSVHENHREKEEPIEAEEAQARHTLAASKRGSRSVSTPALSTMAMLASDARPAMTPQRAVPVVRPLKKQKSVESFLQGWGDGVEQKTTRLPVAVQE